MNTKNLIRTLVLAGLVLWPTVETFRYWVAKQQLATSIELREYVDVKLAEARVKYAGTEAETPAL